MRRIVVCTVLALILGMLVGLTGIASGDTWPTCGADPDMSPVAVVYAWSGANRWDGATQTILPDLYLEGTCTRRGETFIVEIRIPQSQVASLQYLLAEFVEHP